MPLTLVGLESWADLLLTAFIGCGPGDASLVRLVEPPGASGDVELGLLRLDGAHPCEVLDELLVEPACVALGVAAGGWAAPLGPLVRDGPIRPSAHPDAERILQVVLVARSGEVVSRVRFPDGTVLTAPPAEGAVLSSLREALAMTA